jgi:hypothetical protein
MNYTFLPLDPRKSHKKIYTWCRTEDKYIQTICLHKPAMRHFPLNVNILHIPDDITLPENYFSKTYKSPDVYLVKINNSTISPRPKGYPRYWGIFGESHYIWNAISDAAKIALVNQGELNYSVHDQSISFDQKNIISNIDRDCVWLYVFSNYNHFIQETLPTLLMMKDLGYELNDYFYLVGEEKGYDEILIALGLNSENIIHNKNQWIKCKSLLYPSFLSFGHLYNPTMHLDRLSELIRQKINQPASLQHNSRIYLSRKLAKFRKIINEDKLIKRLKELDFVDIDPGSLSKIEQVSYFRATRHIVGPHGMGMNNIFFAQNLLSVTEIFTTSWLRPAYWRMSQSKGSKYSLYAMHPVNDNQDIDVDIDCILEDVQLSIKMGG